MSNVPFDSYRKILVGDSATGLIDWNADTMKAALIDQAVVAPNPATHDFWDDLVAALVGPLATLAGVTFPSAGKVDCNDWVFTAVSGATAEQLVIFKSTGVNSTSPLAVRYDTFATGMPVTPNGGDINVTAPTLGLFTIGS